VRWLPQIDASTNHFGKCQLIDLKVDQIILEDSWWSCGISDFQRDEQCWPAAHAHAAVRKIAGQKTGIAGDLAARKIGADGLMTVEGEAQLW
jgi:hypothetical protein